MGTYACVQWELHGKPPGKRLVAFNFFFFVCVSVLPCQTMSVQGECVTSGEKGIFPISISAFNLAVQGAGSQPGK